MNSDINFEAEEERLEYNSFYYALIGEISKELDVQFQLPLTTVTVIPESTDTYFALRYYPHFSKVHQI